MMAKQTDRGAANENPLIPNERLRQIYLAMAQARVLDKALPAARRGQTHGLEAALVSAAVDLGPGDLVSDALACGVVNFLRGTTLGEVLQAGKADASRRSRRSGTGVRGRSAECGAAGRLPGTADAAERIWTALGAAAALKAAATLARIETQSTAKDKAEADATAATRQAGVVVVYALAGEASAGLWKKALRFAAEQELPVVFVVLPSARTRGGGARLGAKSGGVSALAEGCGVPAMVVDADDAVAIYRVAQESIGHARIGGGAALIECVPFVLAGAAGKVRAAQDAIAGLERTMLQRGVASRTWMEREAKSFAKRIARWKSGSCSLDHFAIKGTRA
jgi:TPP-dependent pyruvate/acetoin dehydrogenase alpha subunit